MWTKHFLFLVGALCMCQVFSQDIYVAEVMVESNVTLTSESILASWRPTISLSVGSNVVTISSSELVAECLVVGEEYSCNCSKGYAWSNEVCYNYGCCTEATCLKNVSQATSICVEKFNVVINGSVQLTAGSWTSAQTTMLETGLRMMNGVGSVNITGPRLLEPAFADFQMDVYVRLDIPKLQQILNGLTVNLSSAPIYVDTKKMVNVSVKPNDTVKYETNINLACVMEEATGSAGWNLSTPSERFSINKGLQTQITTACVNEVYKSCVELIVTKVTGVWTGIYECGFTTGTIRHTASIPIKVAPLPDVITMKFSPMIVDCSGNNHSVNIIATIPKPEEEYKYLWSYNGANDPNDKETNAGKSQISFTYNRQLECEYKDPQRVQITFINSLNQKKTATVEIPVFRETAKFCKEETLNNEIWLKTPADVTLINQTCPPGRVGFKSRICDKEGMWQDVFSKCISEELSKVTDAANNFLNGLGATQEVAMNIFEGVKNSSSLSSDGSGDDVADIGASIGIIGVMANASVNIVLNEDVFPDLVDAASNMVNSSWSAVNDTIRYGMSANYLSSVETLVKNININTSEGFNSTNLELKFCSSDDCSINVFGIDVNLNKTNGTMKTLGVKNLMEKMKNDKFPGRNRSSILLSATLVGNSDSDIKIKMFFPDEQPTATERLCVFWDTNKTDWSSEGCIANVTDDNQTLCECNHLTSFSVLMSKSANVKDSSILDMITNIGLGVSIFSLLIFLFVESLVWSAVTKTNLSHFRHTAVVNIAVFRLLADCSFLASTEPTKLSDTWCFTFTVCKHLFYLTMFCWMLCLSVMLVHQLIFVFSPVRKRVFMYLSSIVGYVVPIALVGTSYVYYKYKEQDYYDRKSCWLTYVRLLEGSIHAFLLPVGTIILSNLFSMVVVIVTLVKTSVPDSSKSDDKDTAKSILKVIVFLAPVFGVTWIIGFALLMLDGNNPLYEVAEYAFVILNSFQGLFILLTGCVGEQKVRQEVIRIIMAKTGKDTDSTKKLTNSSTTLYTKDK
ncbi:adhesion G protein-coupled receptor F5 [Poecilia formosa]|uniref:Adhesion G protein-coupled receptor F5-like n=1 Tax=Poecilia formosa TaxID=48698 RepID=A0A087X3S0_POEFO|nr:PREDICTED: adhesion G protein-coupled receptor F5-like [Poecilia formosa]